MWCGSSAACALAACLVALTAISGMAVFADHLVVEVDNVKGSSMPGCETTNDCFVPHTATIDVGGKVIWSNPDLTAHTVTSGTIVGGMDGVFDSGLMSPGVDFSYTFNKAGTYPYFCLVHPWMIGVVVVQDGSNTVPSHDARPDAQVGDTIVVLHTGLGQLTIELFPDDAPNHVENFVALAEDGFYDQTIFHRIIPGFIIQGGDPNTKPGSGYPESGWGTGGPVTTVAAEFNDIMHNRGIVSMARASHPDSAGSQFFIVHQDANFLDGQYTVFGRLATQDSYDTLDAIASARTTTNDRPIQPDSVRIIAADVLTRSQAAASGIDLLDQQPPARIQQTTTAPGQTNTAHTDENLNLSIVFPKGWVIQTPGGGDSPDIAAVGPLTGVLPPNMAVYVDNAAGRSLDDIVQIKLAGLQEYVELGTLEILNQDRVDINGREVFLLDAAVPITIAGQTIDTIYREATLIASGTIYTFLYINEAHSFDSDMLLFEESLRSFRVLKDDSGGDIGRYDTSALSDAMGLFAAVLALAVLNAGVEGALIAEYGTAEPIYNVASGSMSPALKTGDLVVISELVKFEEVEPGDIIVYNHPLNHTRVIVHRVVLVTDDDPRTLRAKGDANPASIPGTDFNITGDDYIGKVVNVIRYHNTSGISTDGDPFLGMAGAPIDIIAFIDIQCPSCIRFHVVTLPDLEEQYLNTGLARLTYRDFPDRNAYPNAVNAAAAAKCAGDQDRYWEYRDVLSDRAGYWGDLSRARALAQFESYAETIGLDRDMFLVCLNSGEHTPEVITDYTDGISYGVDATPTLFVGNAHTGYYQISGSPSYAEIQSVIHYVLGAIFRDALVSSQGTTN